MEVQTRRKRLRRIADDDDSEDDGGAKMPVSDEEEPVAAGSEVGEDENLSDYEATKPVEKKRAPAKRKGIVRKVPRKKKVMGGEVVEAKTSDRKRKKAEQDGKERVSVLKEKSAADKAMLAKQEALKRGEEARKRIAEQLAKKNAAKKEGLENANKTRKISGALKRKLEKQESDFENRKSKALRDGSAEFDCDECVVFVQGWAAAWDLEELQNSMKRFSERFQIRLVGDRGLAAVVRFESELTALDAVETQHHVGTKLKIRKARPGDDPKKWFARPNSPTHNRAGDNWMGTAGSGESGLRSPRRDQRSSDTNGQVNVSTFPSSPPAKGPVFPVSPTRQESNAAFFPVSPGAASPETKDDAPLFPVSPSKPPTLEVVAGAKNHGVNKQDMETPRKTARISFLMNPEPHDRAADAEEEANEDLPAGAVPVAAPQLKTNAEPAEIQPIRGVRRVQVYDDDV